MVGVFVSSHDELFLRPFETNWTHRFGTLARNIDVCHLIWATSWLGWNLVLPLLVGQTDRITELTWGSNCWQHRLRQIVHTRRIVYIHIFWILHVPILVNWWFSSLYMLIIVRTISQLWLIIICVILIIAKIIFAGIVRQTSLLLILHLSSLVHINLSSIIQRWLFGTTVLI